MEVARLTADAIEWYREALHLSEVLDLRVFGRARLALQLVDVS